MKRFAITYRSKDGSRQVMTLLAKDKDEAERLAERAQHRRHERFPITFARLEHAAATGEPGLLAIDPKFGGKALTEAWVKAETERRKHDQARYDDGDLKIESVEEMK
jgi:hypothetical protein